MKKIIFFLLAALVIFSCNVTKPNENNNNQNSNQGGSQQVDPLRQGLVAEYLMGEDSLDTGGNRNHAFLNGPLPTFNRLGQFRSAYRFDGIDDYLEVRNHPTLHSDRALSISGWVYVEELSDIYQNIFYKVNTPMDSTNMSHREYSLWIHKTGVLHFNSTPKGGNTVVSCVTDSPVVRKKRWYHFVSIVDSDSNRMAIYLDGTLVEEIEYDAQKRDIRTSNGALIFGMGGGIDGLHPLNGGLDDIRIYNRALSESEIKELYKAE